MAKAHRRLSAIPFNHGLSHTRENKAWRKMKGRCLTPTDDHYPYYGGRGITVCDRWVRSFANFLADMGPRPSAKHSIDRIDVNGNYEPGNCRWATRKEQAENRRMALMLSHGGKTQCASKWAAEIGVPPRLIRKRIALGWSASEALTTPVLPTGRTRANATT